MSRDNPNHSHGAERSGSDLLSWPPLRSDLVALACLGVVVYCLLERTWPVLAIAALGGTVLAGLAPRMQGAWGLRMWGGGISGAFRDRDD
jgi:hypothetical protein